MRIEHLSDSVTDQWVTIYAICEPVEKWKTGDVRYVGKTARTPWQRVRAHSYKAKRSARLPVHRWLRKHMEMGNPFHIRHLERVRPGDDWAAREMYWISHFRANGQLLNLTDGGEGLSGLPKTAEHREKIAAAMRKGNTFVCERCGKEFWRKRSDIIHQHNKFCSRSCSNRRHK